MFKQTDEKNEKMQFFGSTVERFVENNKNNNVEIGPCSYDVSNKIERKRLVNPTVYSGFSSAANRFAAEKLNED